jgi:uncharacterized protein YaaQ
MKLAVVQIKGARADALIQGLIQRGFAVDIVSQESFRGEQRRTSAFVPVQESYLPDLLRFVEEQGLAFVKMTNPMLPLVDPAEYHVSSPVPSLDGGATVYILNLSRYERIR